MGNTSHPSFTHSFILKNLYTKAGSVLTLVMSPVWGSEPSSHVLPTV